MKVVINKCFGGFGLSTKAIKRYLELCGKECFFYNQDYSSKLYNKIKEEAIKGMGVGNITLTKDYGESFEGNWKLFEKDYFYEGNLERTDPNLIKVVEELGKEADSWASKLKVVEIPDGIEYEIDDYDGIESIHEKHRSW